MSVSNSVLIATSLAKGAAEHEEGLENRLRAAMKATWRQWPCENEDDQFKAAVAGVMMLTEGRDRERLEAEMRALRNLSALMSGVPLDMGAFAASLPEDPDEVIGLMRLWDEVKGSRS